MADGNVPADVGQDYAERIETFVHARFPLARERGIARDESLLDEGILDSLGILDVVAFLEESFGVSVQDEELDPENFDSIDALASFVRAKLS